MASTVYVAGVEPDTGKAVVALGVMELLAGRVGKVGFFRPIVESATGDRLVELMRARYGLPFEEAELVGVSYDELHELSADEVAARVVERFRAVESRCDAVLCVGSDFTDVTAPTELALNLRIADNLGAAVIAVVSGRRKTPDDVVAAVGFATETLARAGVATVAVVANRVDPGDAAAIAARVPGSYVLPYDPVLAEPTVGEVIAQVGGRVLVGDPAQLERDVRGVLVAAATLPNVLDRLVEGGLVLTPGTGTRSCSGCWRRPRPPVRRTPAGCC